MYISYFIKSRYKSGGFLTLYYLLYFFSLILKSILIITLDLVSIFMLLRKTSTSYFNHPNQARVLRLNNEWTILVEDDDV